MSKKNIEKKKVIQITGESLKHEMSSEPQLRDLKSSDGVE
jgi:hypothetical protein